MAKYETAEDALARGAHHLDVVINIAAVKNGDWETVENDIETLTRLVHAENRIIKLIAETGLMTEIETDLICKIANTAKVDYVKTSTGVNAPGADVEIVKTLRSLLSPDIKIKASGGIKTGGLLSSCLMRVLIGLEARIVLKL
jgi:deoxyribose-phosphate aldolase